MKNIFYSAFGTIISTFILFISVPLAINSIGNIGYSIISLWLIGIIIIQLLDFGICQYIIRESTYIKNKNDKLNLCNQYNKIIILLITIFSLFSIFVQKPIEGVYNNIGHLSWIIFKISLILNLKIIYNLTLLNLLNKHKDYCAFSIVLSISRSIIPIIIYLIFENDLSISIYFLVSTIIMILVSERMTGLSLNEERFFDDLLKVIKNKEKKKQTIALYVSALLAIVLSMSDRLIATYSFQVREFVIYSATFTFASAVNIVVQPFYRILLSNLTGNNDSKNAKIVINLTKLQSYLILFIIGSILLFFNEIISLLFSTVELNYSLLCILLISFWGVSNGWLIATEISYYKNKFIQVYAISIALIVYSIILLWNKNNNLFINSSIWVIHGIIQLFFIPIFSKINFSIKSYFKWVFEIILTPFFTLSIIFFFLRAIKESSMYIFIINYIIITFLFVVIVYRFIKNNLEFE